MFNTGYHVEGGEAQLSQEAQLDDSLRQRLSDVPPSKKGPWTLSLDEVWEISCQASGNTHWCLLRLEQEAMIGPQKERQHSSS